MLLGQQPLILSSDVHVLSKDRVVTVSTTLSVRHTERGLGVESSEISTASIRPLAWEGECNPPTTVGRERVQMNSGNTHGKGTAACVVHGQMEQRGKAMEPEAKRMSRRIHF